MKNTDNDTDSSAENETEESDVDEDQGTKDDGKDHEKDEEDSNKDSDKDSNEEDGHGLDDDDEGAHEASGYVFHPFHPFLCVIQSSFHDAAHPKLGGLCFILFYYIYILFFFCFGNPTRILSLFSRVISPFSHHLDVPPPTGTGIDAYPSFRGVHLFFSNRS